MSSYYIITWMSGQILKETRVGPTDIWNVASMASGMGVNVWTIIKIEMEAQ